MVFDPNCVTVWHFVCLELETFVNPHMFELYVYVFASRKNLEVEKPFVINSV